MRLGAESRLTAMERVVRVGVTVTFLRMDAPPLEPPPSLPKDARIVLIEDPPVALYRSLYDGVGGAYCWWLRRTMPDAALALLLRDPRLAVHVLYIGGQAAGFAELDARAGADINLSYFGLLPHAVGRGLGYSFLCHAVRLAWSHQPRALTVNTCTADHPRALPNYLRAGFRQVRQVREVWDVPARLGLIIPPALRVS